MKIRFSATTKQFYPLDIQYSDIPDDVQEVNISLFESAMNRPIGASFDILDGSLVIVPPSAPAFAEIASVYLDSVRVVREQVLNRLAGIGMAALLAADTATAQAAADARLALLDITIAPAVLAAKDLNEMVTAMQAAYAAVIAAVPPVIREAFDPGAI